MTALALQPEYRALMMFDRLPVGCIAHLVTDSYSQPHIRAGEWVVVDTADRAPRLGEVYLIQWLNGRRSICQVRQGKSLPDLPRPDLWFVGGLSNPQGPAAIKAALDVTLKTGTSALGWSDGPFRIGSGHLEGKLVGSVIGLYQPIAEGPLREINP